MGNLMGARQCVKMKPLAGVTRVRLPVGEKNAARRHDRRHRTPGKHRSDPQGPCGKVDFPHDPPFMNAAGISDKT